MTNLWTIPYNTDIHFFGGEKGGVGKSTVCRSVLEYHLDRNIDCNAVETDRSNPDVKRCFGNLCNLSIAIFGESIRHEDAANSVLNSGLSRRTLVNMPAQVQHSGFSQWLRNNDIIEIAQDGSVRLVWWHVSDCGFDSLKLFRRSLKEYGTVMPHVFVKNYGMTEDWEPFDKDAELQDLVAKYAVNILEFPKFIGNKTRNSIDSHSLTYGEALTWKEFGPIERQRVRSFLRKAFQAFDASEIFTPVTTARRSVKSPL